MNRQQTGKKARENGYKAERFAALFLQLKGYKILERNFKPPRGSGAGEIDIIACKNDVLVFVVVKRRPTLETAAETVNRTVQTRRIRGAEYFIATHPELSDKEMRFDVILISPNRFPEHIRNAFMSDF